MSHVMWFISIYGSTYPAIPTSRRTRNPAFVAHLVVSVTTLHGWTYHPFPNTWRTLHVFLLRALPSFSTLFSISPHIFPWKKYISFHSSAYTGSSSRLVHISETRPWGISSVTSDKEDVMIWHVKSLGA